MWTTEVVPIEAVTTELLLYTLVSKKLNMCSRIFMNFICVCVYVTLYAFYIKYKLMD